MAWSREAPGLDRSVLQPVIPGVEDDGSASMRPEPSQPNKSHGFLENKARRLYSWAQGDLGQLAADGTGSNSRIANQSCPKADIQRFHAEHATTYLRQCHVFSLWQPCLSLLGLIRC